LEYPRDDTWLIPLQHLLEIKRWGTKWKMAIDKTYKWTTWHDGHTPRYTKKVLHSSNKLTFPRRIWKTTIG
jgi:hypothetical protein